jgi:hypothetical protein
VLTEADMAQEISLLRQTGNVTGLDKLLPGDLLFG